MRGWLNLAGATLDHLVSVTILLAAILLFVSLFNQTIQTAVVYQQHRAAATKCSDLLDTMLLNPSIPVDAQPTVFGLHDTEFTQYVLNPFSIMRLNSSIGARVYYAKTGIMYSNTPVGFGNSLLVPINNSVTPLNNVVNYSSALKMLEISGAYGFQLALTPAVTISISNISTSPLTLSINASGISFPLAGAAVSYRLIPVSLSGAYPDYLTIPNQAGTVLTNAAGFGNVTFTNFTPNATCTYVFLAYVHVGGLAGVGLYMPSFSGSQRLTPFVASLNGTVLLAHSSDVPNTAPSSDRLNYTSAFVKLSNGNFELQDITTGDVWSGAAHDPATLPVRNDAGIRVVAYTNGAGSSGVAVLPWGVGSLAFPVAFGGNSTGQEWVATDLRQVLVGGVAYQAKLSLWSLQGVQVVG